MSRYSIFDSFHDVCFGIDDAGRVFYGNNAAILLFDVSSKRLANGRSLEQLVTFEPDPMVLLRSPPEGEQPTKVLEVKYTVHNGTSGWGQLVFQPETEALRDSKAPVTARRWIATMRDVSLEKTLHEKYRGEIDQKETVIDELKIARNQLERHSRDLEVTVSDRTRELSETNRMLKTILDSLGQGILVFDREGICLPIYSQVCRRLLDVEPKGLVIEDVLNLAAQARKNFELWRGAVFDQLLDFEDMVPLTIRRLTNKTGAEISLDYYPMYEADGKLLGIVVVTTDRTIEMQALRRAEREREVVLKVTRVARNKEAFRIFIVDANKLIDDIQNPASLDLPDVARRLHTLKGGAASFHFTNIVDLCHHLEDDLKANAKRDRSGFNQFMKLKSEEMKISLDQEVKMLSDLLGTFANASMSVVELPTSRLRQWSEALITASDISDIHEIGFEIQACGEKSVGGTIENMGPFLTELAVSRKKILNQFSVDGGDLKIPEDFAPELITSLAHALRNSVYHGLEEPEERKVRGKTAGGNVSIHFRMTRRGDQEWLKVEIEDDGRGIDPEMLRRRLRKDGSEHLAQQSDEKVLQVILRDDFTTNDTVDTVSGRGLGLAAIASEVRKLSGTIEVVSTVGAGTTLKISVPLPRRASRAVKQVS